jgi:hypothetical protein
MLTITKSVNIEIISGYLINKTIVVLPFTKKHFKVFTGMGTKNRERLGALIISTMIFFEDG